MIGILCCLIGVANPGGYDLTAINLYNGKEQSRIVSSLRYSDQTAVVQLIHPESGEFIEAVNQRYHFRVFRKSANEPWKLRMLGFDNLKEKLKEYKDSESLLATTIFQTGIGTDILNSDKISKLKSKKNGDATDHYFDVDKKWRKRTDVNAPKECYLSIHDDGRLLEFDVGYYTGLPRNGKSSYDKEKRLISQVMLKRDGNHEYKTEVTVQYHAGPWETSKAFLQHYGFDESQLVKP